LRWHATDAGTGKRPRGCKKMRHAIEITIDGDDGKEEKKSRSFVCHLLNFVTADDMWAGGQANTDAYRPVYARIAGSSSILKSFVANLRMGRSAQYRVGYRGNQKLEFLRTGSYQYDMSQTEYGSICTISLIDVVEMDTNTREMRFVCVTPVWYKERYGDDAEAVRFFSYVRSRTRRPLIPNIDYARLLLSLGEQCQIVGREDKPARGWVVRDWVSEIASVLFINTSHDGFETFLRDVTKLYIQRGNNNGTTC